MDAIDYWVELLAEYIAIDCEIDDIRDHMMDMMESDPDSWAELDLPNKE